MIELTDDVIEQLSTENETIEEAANRVLREALDIQSSDPDELAESAMTVSDAKVADREALSPAEYMRQKYNLDPEEYNGEAELLADVRAARREIDG